MMEAVKCPHEDTRDAGLGTPPRACALATNGCLEFVSDEGI